MGLDMYAFAKHEALPEPTEFFYWRKHPNLHGWMEQLYRSKGGTEEFNCERVNLTIEDLDVLEDVVINNNLEHTEGFFFGVSGERKEEDLQFIKLARDYISQGHSVYYTSWW